MIDQWVKQLKSRDAEQRKQAVKALARTQDPAAIEYLTDVMERDSDPEVSDLAFKAIAYIKKKTGYTGDSASSMLGGYGGDADEDQIPQSQKVQVSQRDMDRAQSLVDQAMNVHTQGDDDQAADYLKKAFKTNPNLKYNSDTIGLAASITGLGSEDAVRRLTADEAKQAKPKAKRGDRDRDTMTWGDALVDLAIYGLVITGSVGAALFALLYLVVIPYVQASGASSVIPSGRTASPLDPAQLIALMNTEGAKYIVLIALVIGVTSMVVLFIQYVSIHIAATSILGGEGSLVGLIRKMTLFLAAVYALSIIIIIVGLVFTVTSPRNVTSINTFNILFELVIFVVMSMRIGSVYGFGGFKGCASIFIGSILLVVAGIVLAMLLSPSGAR
jgi:hypothetical protein